MKQSVLSEIKARYNENPEFFGTQWADYWRIRTGDVNHYAKLQWSDPSHRTHSGYSDAEVYIRLVIDMRSYTLEYEDDKVKCQ